MFLRDFFSQEASNSARVDTSLHLFLLLLAVVLSALFQFNLVYNIVKKETRGNTTPLGGGGERGGGFSAKMHTMDRVSFSTETQQELLGSNQTDLTVVPVLNISPPLTPSPLIPATHQIHLPPPPQESGTGTRSLDYMANKTLSFLQKLRNESGITSINRLPASLHEYVRFRKQKTNPTFYSHFADRLWLNMWPKARRCNASVPPLLAFFPPNNISGLLKFVAPDSGAVVKINHQAGGVTVLGPNSSLSAKQMEFYKKEIDKEYSSKIEPHYTIVPHGVIIEGFLAALAGGAERPPDFKFYAFDGNISIVLVMIRRKKAVRQPFISTPRISGDFLSPPHFRCSKDFSPRHADGIKHCELLNVFLEE